MRAPVPLSLLLAALLAPLAGAHAAFDGGAPLGEASLFLELVGAPIPSAGTPMELRVRTDAPEPPEVRMVPPSGEPEAWRPMLEEDGRWSAPVVMGQPGRWSVDVRAGAESASFSFDAWPRAGAWLVPAGEAAARGIVVAGERAPVRVQLVDATGHPLPPPPDAVARIEGPDGNATVPMKADGDALTLERTWDQPGEHLLHVGSASARLPNDARPPVALLVVPAEEASVYGLDEEPRKVPLGAAPLLAAALVACALLAHARRR